MTIATSKLPCGLRIVTDRMTSVESVSLGVWVEAGTRNEAADISGVSHLLEHMAFKGTTSRTAYDIASQIEDVGGFLNAYTSHEMTVYHATVLRQHVPLAIDVIADILRNSTFDEAELERERSVVLQEIRSARDTPEETVADWFQETAFPDQPYGRPILGTPEIVERLPRETLIDYINTHYGADRMIFAAAGNIDPDEIVRLVSNAFGDLRPSSGAPAAPPLYSGGDRREHRSLEQVQFMLGFEGAGYGDESYYGLAVLSRVLGGGSSSRLFQEVREKRGLVYAIDTFTSVYFGGGLFGVYAGSGAETIDETVRVLCHELDRLTTEEVTGTELMRAQNQIKASMLMSLESTASRAERIARQTSIHGRTIDVEELNERIDSVTAADLRRIAARVLASQPTVAALGPIQHLPAHGVIQELLN